MSFVDLGGVSPMGPRARNAWRSRLRNATPNPVTKVAGGMGGARLAGGTFQRGAAPAGGGFRGGRRHHGHRRHHGGFYPYYPYYYPYPYSTLPSFCRDPRDLQTPPGGYRWLANGA